MCTCQKPTRNDNTVGGYHYSMPEPEQGEVILFEEPGRCSPAGDQIDYHSHNFRLFGNGGHCTLAVKHGGGVERFDIGWSHTHIPEILLKLDSDERYLMLYALFTAHREERRITQAETALKWRTAFVDGTLKKRKMPGKDAYKVTLNGWPA